jgi:hypothetical protein
MLPTASVLFCDEGRPSDFEKPRSARMWQPFVTNAPQVRGLPKWQEALYIAMERNSVHVRDFFRLPNDSVVLTKRSFCSPTDISLRTSEKTRGLGPLSDSRPGVVPVKSSPSHSRSKRINALEQKLPALKARRPQCIRLICARAGDARGYHVAWFSESPQSGQPHGTVARWYGKIGEGNKRQIRH